MLLQSQRIEGPLVKRELMLYTTIGSVHKNVNYNDNIPPIPHIPPKPNHLRYDLPLSQLLFYSIYHITLQQVRLHFVRSMLGADDYIEINSRLLRTFNSGDNISSYIVSSRNSLFVSFHAASHKTSDFWVEYNAIEGECERRGRRIMCY